MSYLETLNIEIDSKFPFVLENIKQELLDCLYEAMMEEFSNIKDMPPLGGTETNKALARAIFEDDKIYYGNESTDWKPPSTITFENVSPQLFSLLSKGNHPTYDVEFRYVINLEDRNKCIIILQVPNKYLHRSKRLEDYLDNRGISFERENNSKKQTTEYKIRSGSETIRLRRVIKEYPFGLREMGFTSVFKHDKNGNYTLEIGDEVIESELGFSLENLIKTPEKFISKKNLGEGHSHPVYQHIPSDVDVYLDMGVLHYRPNVLINPNGDCILYLPNKGYFFTPKDRIYIGKVNEGKTVVDLIK